MSDLPPPPGPPVPPSGPGGVGAGGSSAPSGADSSRFPPPESGSTRGSAGGQPGYGPPIDGGFPASGGPVAPPAGHTPYASPGYAQPGYAQPGYIQPGYVQPHGSIAGGPGSTGGPKRGLAIAALVVGGVSVLLALVPILSYLAIVTAIVGVVLGIIALRQTDGSKGIALGGLITSAVALLLALVLSVVYTNWFISSFDDLDDLGPSASPFEPDDPFDDGLGDGTDDGTDDVTTGLGSRDEPDAIGATSRFRDIDELPVWEVTPGVPTLDANSLVAADDYNEPPPAGTQYAILPLTITYVGTATGQPYEIEVQFVAADGTSYDTDDVYAVIPEDLYDGNELYPGGSATGNVVIPIPTDAVEGGTWAIRTGYDGPYFYSVQ